MSKNKLEKLAKSAPIIKGGSVRIQKTGDRYTIAGSTLKSTKGRSVTTNSMSTYNRNMRREIESEHRETDAAISIRSKDINQLKEKYKTVPLPKNFRTGNVTKKGVKSLAASVLAQNETKGKRKKP